MRRASLFRHHITFQEKTVARDSFGSEQIKWVSKFSTLADIVFKSGSKENVNYELVNSQVIEINIRFRPDIKETFQIKHNNDYYEILSINPVVYNSELQIIAKKIEPIGEMDETTNPEPTTQGKIYEIEYPSFDVTLDAPLSSSAIVEGEILSDVPLKIGEMELNNPYAYGYNLSEDRLTIHLNKALTSFNYKPGIKFILEVYQ